VSAPAPLPLTWRLYCTIHCPNCGKDFNFEREADLGQMVRTMYCPTPECPQYGHVYRVEFDSFAVQVVEVVK
jgi:hypothetical protein